MREAQPPGVQHLPGESRALPIEFIAEHGMTEVLEVHADLVVRPLCRVHSTSVPMGSSARTR